MSQLDYCPKLAAAICGVWPWTRACGVAIENLAGDDVEKLAAPFKHQPKAPDEEDTGLSGSLVHDLDRWAIGADCSTPFLLVVYSAGRENSPTCGV